MTAEIFYDRHEGLLRTITLRGGKVADCAFEDAEKPSRSGAVLLGVVDRLLPSGRGAFVKISENETGFLNEAEGLSSGQRLPVQIKADARDDKGPLLTQNISLPSAFFIYHPFGSGVHTSRRMERNASDEALDAIEDMLEGTSGGFTIRSAALYATPQQLEQELKNLQTAASSLQQGAADYAQIIPAPSAFEAAVLAAAGEKTLTIKMEEGMGGEATAYLRRVCPQVLSSYSFSAGKGVFEEGDLSGFCEKLFEKNVPLLGGGDVVIEHTEALHSIDVNGATRTHTLEVNRQAAEAIMQQIRWRNLGGVIVIDFLRMRSADERHEIADLLRELAEDDPLPVDVYGFTRMGLCELSRARRGFSLAEYGKAGSGSA